MRIHFVANIHRPDAIEAVDSVAKWIAAKGISIGVEPESGRHLNLPVISNETFSDCDLVVAFGGDGTLIRAAHLCSERGTPLLGVYYGRFGFVTQCNPDNVRDCLDNFIAGKGKVESRIMLEASLIRDGIAVATLHALNEAVLQRSISARMMTFEVRVDGYSLTSYPSDGVMVCTPTGSTGYNLSAGGPIVDPRLEGMILSAIAPHTLSSRSLILRPDSQVEFKVQSGGGDSVLSADGQTRLHIMEGDEVRIKKSVRHTNLVMVSDDDFLVKLHQRLFWSKGLI